MITHGTDIMEISGFRPLHRPDAATRLMMRLHDEYPEPLPGQGNRGGKTVGP